MSTFKAFSNKANAQRKAKQLGVDVVQQDGVWGVLLTTQVETLPLVKQLSPWNAMDLDYSQRIKKEVVKVPSFKGFGVIPTGQKVNLTEFKIVNGVQTCPKCGSQEIWEGTNKNGMVSDDGAQGCHHCDWTNKAKRTPKPENKTGRKVQKDRETRNGVTRPSVGTLCGDVWAAMDSETSLPNAVTAKRLAATNGWNVNNALIEVYRWKKFHA